ncbi:MAG: hydrolase [Sphaerochaeta sp.]|nr:hypothetical protein [Sphaerochaeta sp.]
MDMQVQEEICCPPFDPKPWTNTFVTLDDKQFIKEKVRTFFFMPINFGGVMKRVVSKVERAGGTVVDNMVLSDHQSKWRMDVYIAVDREIPGCEQTHLSGTFLSQVYEGPFSDTAIWTKDFERLAKEKGLEIKRWFMWYTTCPKCAKKYGKNYVVILGS